MINDEYLFDARSFTIQIDDENEKYFVVWMTRRELFLLRNASPGIWG